MDNEEFVKAMVRQRGGREQPEWTWMAEVDPEYIKAYVRLTQSAFGYYAEGDEYPCVLPAKIKELIAIALLTGQRDWERLPLHMERAMDLGATDREILEALQTAMVITGGPAMRGGVEMMLRMRKQRGQVKES